MTLPSCPCGDPGKVRCTDCARPLCTWHHAHTPIQVENLIRLVPVCLPDCRSVWWTQPTSDSTVIQ